MEIPQSQASINKDAASAAANLSKKSPVPSADWKDKLDQAKKDPAVKQYIAQLAQGWAKTAGTLIKPTQGLTSTVTLQKTIPALVSAAKKTNNNLTSTQIGQILAKSAPTIWNNTADKSAAIAQLKNELEKQRVTVDGASVSTASAKPATKYYYGKPGQMSSSVAASKAGKDLQKMFGQPRGGIQSMQSDLAEASLPDAIKGNIQQWKDTFKGSTPAPNSTTKATPTTTTAPSAMATVGPAADQYREAFVRWSDAQLASKDPVTYRAIAMDDVRALPGLGAKLDQALQAVVSARDTPQSTAAIAQYLELAVAGVQARSQEIKNKAPEVAAQALSGAQANLASIQQTLSQVGVNPRALSAFGSKAKSKNVVTTGNAEADALLKQAGFSL
jgi:hypothetical protein